MPSFNLDKVKEDSISSIGKHTPFKFGFEHSVDIDIIKVGERLNLAHGTLHRVRFLSTGAISINLFLTTFIFQMGHTYIFTHQIAST